MAGQRSVASFAGHNHMLTLFFLFHDVGMAGLTGIVAGECNGPGRSLGDRSPAIMPVLPKAFRNDGSA